MPNTPEEPRIRRSALRFNAPFMLRDLALEQPAGTYKVDTTEALIEGEFKPVATELFLRVGASIRIRAVDREDLFTAWLRDGKSCARSLPKSGEPA